MRDEQRRNVRARHAEGPVLPAEDVGASEAARTWRPLVQPGMYVLGTDGDALGQVKEVRAADFLLDRAGATGPASATPIYLPFERIDTIMADRITLDLPGSQLDERGTVPRPLNL
jgi:hypothetical protein